MFTFWLVLGGLTAAAAGLILLRAADADDTADPSPQLYRRQLEEIDDLAERGLIAEPERRSAHAEAARRLLAATDAPTVAWTTEPAARRGALIAAAGAPALALGLYFAVGAPGMADLPYAERLRAWRSADLQTLSAPEIAAVLRQVTAERPADPEGLRFLALAEAQSQNLLAAVRALRQATAIAPERADLWRMLGEALAAEAGGVVEGDTEAAFRQALRRDPADVTTRFYLAKAKFDAGRADEAAADLRTLLAVLPKGDSRRVSVLKALGRAEGAPAVQGAQGVNVRAMVDGLAARLKTAPDDPEGWVRLVRAYAVLGDRKARDSALASARARYAGRADVLRQLDEAARVEPMR